MSDDVLEYTSESLEKADSLVARIGLPVPKKPPGDEIVWPSNAADLSLDEVSEHLTWWKGWAAYCSWHLGRAESNREALEEEYNTEYDSRIFKSAGDYDKVTELKASVKQSPDMIRKKKRIVEAKAAVKLLKSLYEGYEGKYAVISRELSRRGVTDTPVRESYKWDK